MHVAGSWSNLVRRTLQTALIALLFACHDEPPTTFPTKVPTYKTPAGSSYEPGVGSPSRSGCSVIRPFMVARTNRTTVWCANSSLFAECLRRAIAAGRSAAYCDSGPGMDSYIESGFVLSETGNVRFYYFDNRGPAYEGLCVRQNVEYVHSFPTCNREISKRDLWPEIRATTAR